jgi:hypothetical protein
MVSSGMLRRVALVRTDVSKEYITFIIRVTRIGELGTIAVTGNRRTMLLVRSSVVPISPFLVTLMKEALSYSETSVLTRATRRNTPEVLIADPEFLGSIPGLPHILRTSGSGTGSTHPREDTWATTTKKKQRLPERKPILTALGTSCIDHATPPKLKVVSSSPAAAAAQVMIKKDE